MSNTKPGDTITLVRYYHVKLEGRRPFWLQVTEESARFVTGWEVNSEGERTHRKHIIERAAATFQDARMNRHYGQLELTNERLCKRCET